MVDLRRGDLLKPHTTATYRPSCGTYCNLKSLQAGVSAGTTSTHSAVTQVGQTYWRATNSGGNCTSGPRSSALTSTVAASSRQSPAASPSGASQWAQCATV